METTHTVMNDTQSMSEDENEDCGFADSSNIDGNDQSNDKLNMDQDIEPTVGMTFPTSEDAKRFYNRHALIKGFGTRVQQSLKNKRTKVKDFVWFACSKQGFKIEKEGVVYKRPNTRVGCNAHLKVKLVDSKWKVISFESNHNHVCSPSKSHRFRSHKHIESGSKKRLELHCDAGIRVNKSFHSMVVDAGGHENVPFGHKDARNYVNKYKRLKLQEGDAEAMHKYFSRMQQKNPNFFYLVDLDPEGRLRNVFWADARSRDAYKYFGEVVTFDTTYLTNRYDLKFAPFVGVNHHGQSVLLGCGLLADETSKTFEWVFNAWLEAMSKRSPGAIITDQCKAMEKAIIKVFPEARHRLCLWHIMKKIPDKLGSMTEYKAIKKAMKNAVYESLRVNEFEEAWALMVEKYKLQENTWLTTLYDLRQKWIPVFLKDVFFAGMSTTQRSESMNAFFDGYVHAKTSLKEFVDQYEMALEDKYEKESQADFDSFNASPPLKTSCVFESQLLKIYTKGMFLKFQKELYSMDSCSKSLVRVDGQITTYAVKERVLDKKGNLLPPKTYEVHFNNGEIEVFCICRLFQHKGILCKHALHVLNEYVDEIPSQYILPRWRKDFKRTYNDNRASHKIDAHNPVHRYDVLYHWAFQILEEGISSESKFQVVLDGFMELKKKVLNENKDLYDGDNELSATPSTEQPNTFQSENVKYLDPLKAKSVGRPKERLKHPSEIRYKASNKQQKEQSSKTKPPKSGPKKSANNKISKPRYEKESNIPYSQSVGLQENISVSIVDDPADNILAGQSQNQYGDVMLEGSTNDVFTSQLFESQNDTSFSGSGTGSFTSLLCGLQSGVEEELFGNFTVEELQEDRKKLN